MTKESCYTQLTDGQIEMLKSNGCVAEDWTQVHVDKNFDPEKCRNVTFSGTNYIGELNGEFMLEGGISYSSSLSNVKLHNCVVGDGVFIDGIANYIANFKIGTRSFIQNVNLIVSTTDSSYGIGTEVSVLNETGGREVPIYHRLSAQMAYLVAMFRHDPRLVNRLRALIKNEAEDFKGTPGTIGCDCRIVNTGIIRNVNIGNHTHIAGASRLDNGTIVSNEYDPVFIGANVMAENFVISSGAKVEDGVVLLNSFVGQACHLSHLFSAHDSLFFANCACENGEAAAIFAGPYTVTMHKSSLLIAGMFSFLNAGSGSNQSNHMYKLGPIHQGVVERGSKTTSDSYILWPARIGAFSLVMGRHVNHPDTTDLPFSYLIESYGRSYLVPGVNIKSVGTIRDARKWPQRDKRKDPVKYDRINFNLLSPFTASKMLDGIAMLDNIEITGGLTADRYTYRGMTIESRALDKGREYYRMALDKFMGNSLIHRLRERKFKSLDEIVETLVPTTVYGTGRWIDLAGMIAPEQEVTRLCDDIVNERINTLSEIEARLNTLADEYYDMEWTWVWDNFERWYGKSCDALTVGDVLDIVERWRKSVVGLDRMLYDDARKEFSLVSKIGFGIDGDSATADADFEQVRGGFEDDSFVKMVVDHIESKSRLADDLVMRVSHLAAADC